MAVRVEAYPDLKLTGKVTLVGTLAQEERDRRGAKFFGVTVQVNESEPRLRPGMTAPRRDPGRGARESLYVPLEAVFEREGRHVCYVVGLARARAARSGARPFNQDFVVIEKGLRRGERVALRDPGRRRPTSAARRRRAAQALGCHARLSHLRREDPSIDGRVPLLRRGGDGGEPAAPMCRRPFPLPHLLLPHPFLPATIPAPAPANPDHAFGLLLFEAEECPRAARATGRWCWPRGRCASVRLT